MSINKCDNCGLCKSVCPVYSVILKETVSPRGLLTLAKEGIDSDDLFRCTLCGACEPQCPYQIEIVQEIIHARERLAKKNKLNALQNQFAKDIIEKGNPYLAFEQKT